MTLVLSLGAMGSHWKVFSKETWEDHVFFTRILLAVVLRRPLEKSRETSSEAVAVPKSEKTVAQTRVVATERAES